MSKLNYNIIGSGSSGNCVVIENIMVDIGLPFKRIKEYLYDIDYILITHIHTDHIRKATYNQIRKLFPKIKFIGNWQVAQSYDMDYISNSGYPVKELDFELLAFECIHDVITHGYVWEAKGNRIIYATDTNNLDSAPSGKYDYLFLESNHDETKIKMAKATKGYDPKLSAMRHLSTFKSKEFYYTHRRNRDSVWVELHKSERFY